MALGCTAKSAIGRLREDVLKESNGKLRANVTQRRTPARLQTEGICRRATRKFLNWDSVPTAKSSGFRAQKFFCSVATFSCSPSTFIFATVDIVEEQSTQSKHIRACQRTEDTLQDVAENEIESNWDQVVDNFDNMDLKPELLRGVYAYGFERPSAIQQRAIVPVVKGHDVIAQAQSGTGKTATFSISILQQLDMSVKGTQALILAPTRELAQQIQKVVIALGDYMNIECHACVGGTNVREDMAKLQEGVHVVVGTPGRVYDMINRRALRTDTIKIFCLDEADEMLSRGFKDQIYEVFQLLPQDTQVVLLSATMPADVLEVTKKFMRDPVRILVKRDELTLEGIKQFYIAVEKEEWKLDTLCDLYETVTITQAVIFCNTRRKVDWLTEKMHSREFTVSAMHGDMEQKQREVLMKEFRSGSSRVLITTDLLARGIDVQQVSLVINYDLPTNRENYIHRIGRGGRFGRKGVAINFVTTEDVRMLRDIEQFYNTQIDEMPLNVAMVRLRGRRGSLKGMMNLPLDLWLEVFTYLKPQDLLALARTSKDIRAFVLNQSQAGVWRRAREAEFPPVPAPMTGLSEPAWIRLLYDPCCGLCGAKDTMLQLQTDTDEIEQKHPGTEIFCYLCPSKTVTVKPPKQPDGGIRWQSDRNKRCYVLRDVIATKERWDALSEEERVSFKQERLSIKANVSEIMMCERWVQEKAEFRARELEEVREERGKEIRERLEELGYNHEIDILGDTFDQHHHVKRPKELTEKSDWQNIREDMIQWMEETKADYRAHALAYRKNLAAEFFAAYAVRPPGSQGYISGFPSEQEFFCFRLVKEILDLPSHIYVDIQTFHDILPAIPRAFQEFRQIVAVHDHLLAIMGPVNLRVDLFHKRAFLSLACNAFVCSPCPTLKGARILHYPEVLTHECNARVPHQWGGQLSSPQRLRDLLATFIRVVGLDPRTASVNDMDRLPYYYRCKRCGGKSVADWRYFIHHLYIHDHSLFPVGEEDVQIINLGGLPFGDYLVFRVTEQGPVSTTLRLQ
ncbi:hypothetical protein IW261DRAFT_1562400 [Armillaria novae-zelandiae]|uniref:ATP-dependent RNA helicase eIF4A n=1 Tax=Armillaria novae-zelandiae TaxID=153914 RepID=A0AA39PEE1_9AGAR|nr:hypothetical protein IW261DRAFT_1562400 [Armillaria novae-zelandiae]